MTGFLVDTNVISELIKPAPNAGLVAWIDQTPEPLIHLSTLTVGELRKGIALLPTGKRRRSLESWLSGDLLLRFQNRILGIDAAISDQWGRFAAKRQQLGMPLAVVDGLLAATAYIHGLSVVSRNVSDFARLDVTIINPWRK